MSLRKIGFYSIWCAVFLLILCLNVLTPMIADDYMYSFSFQTGERIASIGEIIPSMIAHSQTINGRVIAHFFVQLFSMLPRPVFMIINTWVYMLLTIEIYQLTRGPRRYDIGLALLVQAGVFLLPPAFGQSFLWMAGSLNYLWCSTLMVSILLPYANAFFRDGKDLKVHTQVLLCVAALWFGNTSENVSFAVGVLLTGFLILRAIQKRKIKPWMWLTLLFVWIGWGLLMASQANGASLRRSSGGLGVLFEHLQAAISMLKNNGLWPSLLCISLLYVCWKSPGCNRGRVLFGLGAFLAAMVSSLAMVIPDYYPDRAFTGTCILLILACCVLINALPAFFQLKNILAACLAFVMGLTAMSALPNAYNRYACAMNRVQEIQQERSEGTADVVTFGIAGKSKYDAFYHLMELGDKVDLFTNKYMAKYYGVNSIHINRME